MFSSRSPVLILSAIPRSHGNVLSSAQPLPLASVAVSVRRRARPPRPAAPCSTLPPTPWDSYFPISPRHMATPTRWPDTLTPSFISTWVAQLGSAWEGTVSDSLHTWKAHKKTRQGNSEITIEDWCAAFSIPFTGFNETLRETYITQILRATKAQCITTSPPTKWPRTLNRDFIAGWIAAHGDNWESTLTSGLQVWQPQKEHRQGLTTITLEDWGIALGVSFKGYRQDLRPQYVQQILDAARALPRSSTPHDTRRTKWPRILTADFIS
eukprot:3687407-Pyramimonas_sp.AAC.1